jgi:SPP1 family predicted phage head-tail adaptor
MSSLRAGQMNRRITLQRPSTAQDTYGGPVRTWTDLGTFWAEIQPLSGRELESAQRMASEISHQIVVRYQAIFADTRQVAGYRAVYRSRIFNIHAALNEDESNVLITLLASEGLDDG